MKRSPRQLARLVRDAVTLVWRAAPREFSLAASLQVLAGLGAAAQLLLAKAVLDSLLAAEAGDGEFSDALVPRPALPRPHAVPHRGAGVPARVPAPARRADPARGAGADPRRRDGGRARGLRDAGIPRPLPARADAGAVPPAPDRQRAPDDDQRRRRPRRRVGRPARARAGADARAAPGLHPAVAREHAQQPRLLPLLLEADAARAPALVPVAPDDRQGPGEGAPRVRPRPVPARRAPRALRRAPGRAPHARPQAHPDLAAREPRLAGLPRRRDDLPAPVRPPLARAGRDRRLGRVPVRPAAGGDRARRGLAVRERALHRGLRLVRGDEAGGDRDAADGRGAVAVRADRRRGRLVRVPRQRPPGAEGRVDGDRGGPGRRARRRERLGEDDAREAALAPLPAHGRAASSGTARTSPGWTRPRSATRSRSSSRTSSTTSSPRARTWRWGAWPARTTSTRSSRPRGAPARTTSSRSSRRATRRCSRGSSTTRARSSPSASGSWSRSRGPSSATPSCSCSTSRPPPSTPGPSTRCSSGSASSPRAARCS